jgi:hypothetical protein
MADIDDLIHFSMNQQPTKFASAFDEIVGQKAVAAIDDMRITVAQSMFGAEESVDDEDDFDLEDEDFKDIDWDEDDDLDLDNEDLEGFEDDGEDA